MGLYFEQFAVGDTFATGTRRVERDDILQFAELTGDGNPLHTDVEFMRSTPYGEVIAHGLLVQAIAIGLIAELGIMDGTTIALAQADCRFLRPVQPGDEIRAVVEISATRPSSKQVDRGVVERVIRVLNQRDEDVLETKTVSIMRRRPGPGETPGA